MKSKATASIEAKPAGATPMTEQTEAETHVPTMIAAEIASSTAESKVEESGSKRRRVDGVEAESMQRGGFISFRTCGPPVMREAPAWSSPWMARNTTTVTGMRLRRGRGRISNRRNMLRKDIYTGGGGRPTSLLSLAVPVEEKKEAGSGEM
ncbi:hypothetical protein SETIT_9G311200v2 [Setaria italica]|uniref:Uncharacterized protein n=1 Tax=Setaria italica TaxID=4555 RepID=A0A368SPF9_SETIT|nr:hypothetical protein SETIT_9G311200v2 [Setaria italica]